MFGFLVPPGYGQVWLELWTNPVRIHTAGGRAILAIQDGAECGVAFLIHSRESGYPKHGRTKKGAKKDMVLFDPKGYPHVWESGYPHGFLSDPKHAWVVSTKRSLKRRHTLEMFTFGRGVASGCVEFWWVVGLRAFSCQPRDWETSCAHDNPKELLV